MTHFVKVENEQVSWIVEDNTVIENGVAIIAEADTLHASYAILASYNGGEKIVGIMFESNATKGVVKLKGIQEFGDNAAAIAGGLEVDDLYRTEDFIKIVH